MYTDTYVYKNNLHPMTWGGALLLVKSCKFMEKLQGWTEVVIDRVYKKRILFWTYWFEYEALKGVEV